LAAGRAYIARIPDKLKCMFGGGRKVTGRQTAFSQKPQMDVR
jgi:hypothetical protein